MDAKKIDALTAKLGDPGKFQIIAYFCLVCNLILVGCNSMAMAFFAAKTDHHCKLGIGQSKKDFVPFVTNNNNEKLWDGCHIMAAAGIGNNTTVTIPCRGGWTYHLEENEVTIISEFNLVCDDAYKADLAGTIYFAGRMLGTLILSYFADRWGRRPLLTIMLLSHGGFILATFFAKGYVAFILFRFLLGFTIEGVSLTSYVLGLELFQAKYRATSAIFLGLGSSIGGAVLAVLSYAIGDWRYVQLVLFIIPFTQICMFWFVQESLRWLLLKKKFKQAEAVIKRVVSFNNLPFPYEIFDEIKRESDSVEQPGASQTIKHNNAGYLDLIKNSTLRKRVVILFIVWFFVQSAYYALAYNISFLFGNKYLNFGISQFVDIICLLLVTWVVSRFGRRTPLSWGIFLCAVATIITLITQVVKSDAKSLKILGTVTALCGKAASKTAFVILVAFTAELFPTVIRNISLGAANVGGRIGAIAAPQILFLRVYTSEVVPYCIIGGLGLLSGFLILLLPKTHNKPLMDNIEQTNESSYCKEIVVENKNAIQHENLDKPKSTQLGKLDEPEPNPLESDESEAILFENQNAIIHENLHEPEYTQPRKLDQAEQTSLELEKLESTPIKTDQQGYIVVKNHNAISHKNLDKPESTQLQRLDKPEQTSLEKLGKRESTTVKTDQLPESNQNGTPHGSISKPESTQLS